MIGLSLVLFLALVIGVGFAISTTSSPPPDRSPWPFLSKNPPGGCGHGAYVNADNEECRWDPGKLWMGTRIHPDSLAAASGFSVWPQDAICSVCGRVDLHWHNQVEQRAAARAKEEWDASEAKRLAQERKNVETRERMDRHDKLRAAVKAAADRQRAN